MTECDETGDCVCCCVIRAADCVRRIARWPHKIVVISIVISIIVWLLQQLCGGERFLQLRIPAALQTPKAFEMHAAHTPSNAMFASTRRRTLSSQSARAFSAKRTHGNLADAFRRATGAKSDAEEQLGITSADEETGQRIVGEMTTIQLQKTQDPPEHAEVLLSGDV